MTAKPEAIVVGAAVNGLGVVRSLGEEGVRTTVIDDTSEGPALHSRFVASRVILADRADLIDEILRQAAALPTPPVLFLTQEASVAAVCAARERLRGKVRHDWPDANVLTALMDKSQFHVRAEALGFPVPQSLIVTPAEGFERARKLTYPCILKPVTKNAAWDAHFKKAYRFDNFEALATFGKEAAAYDGPVIVQEWIEGADSDVYFTLLYRNERGEIPASFTGRKLTQWPPLVGGTASCVPAPQVEATLSELTARFFKVTGFVGLGSMEYKRDRNSGRFVMVEPTVGRTDYQEEVSTLNGINVVRAAYRSLAGLPPLSSPQTTHAYLWRDAAGDEKSRQAQGLGNTSLAPGARVVDSIFRWNDPGPWLTDLGARIANRLRR